MPNPGIDEYRKYWNEHKVTRQHVDINDDDGTQTQSEVTELTASFVAASCEHEPTNEEWKECLHGVGYTDAKIDEILGEAGNAEG